MRFAREWGDFDGDGGYARRQWSFSRLREKVAEGRMRGPRSTILAKMPLAAPLISSQVGNSRFVGRHAPHATFSRKREKDLRFTNKSSASVIRRNETHGIRVEISYLSLVLVCILVRERDGEAQDNRRVYLSGFLQTDRVLTNILTRIISIYPFRTGAYPEAVPMRGTGAASRQDGVPTVLSRRESA